MQYTENKFRCLTTEKVYSMLVYIYGRNGSEPYGEIVSYYLNGPEVFQNTGELILKMEDICNRLDNSEGDINILLDHGRQSSGSRAARGKALLAVDVRHRYHSSLQGKVRGSLTDWKYVGFRSGMELMRIFRSFVQMQEDGG